MSDLFLGNFARRFEQSQRFQSPKQYN